MWWLVALGSCDYKAGTREHGQWCWEDLDCNGGLECHGSCLYPLESLGIGEECEADWECAGSDLDVGENGTACLEDGDEQVCTLISGDGALITCNDGTLSPTCVVCSSGCCAGQDGCE